MVGSGQATKLWLGHESHQLDVGARETRGQAIAIEELEPPIVTGPVEGMGGSSATGEASLMRSRARCGKSISTTVLR